MKTHNLIVLVLFLIVLIISILISAWWWGDVGNYFGDKKRIKQNVEALDSLKKRDSIINK